MGIEIYNIINDMAEILNASQMQKLQEVLINRLSENTMSDYLQTGNEEFLDMFLTAKHLEGCFDKTIRYYRCNIEKMRKTINIPVVKITTEMLRKYLVEYQSINITVIYCYKNLGQPLKTPKFSWVSFLSHLVSCYLVFPLFTNPHKGKNKGKKIWQQLITNYENGSWNWMKCL